MNFEYIFELVKNRVFISLVCNFLLGIIFCFPIYSYHSVSADEYTEKFYSSFEKKSKDKPEGAGERYIKNLSVVKSSLGNKQQQADNSYHLQTTAMDLARWYEHSPSYQIYFDLTFVNLSYLKELRITKMLC